MSYACVACEGANPVTTLITSLASGQTACACDMDTPLMMITFLASWLEVDTNRLYDTIKRFADKEAKRELAADTSHQADAAPVGDAAGVPDDQDADQIKAADLAADNQQYGPDDPTGDES